MEFNNLKAALLVVIAMSLITTNDAIVMRVRRLSSYGKSTSNMLTNILKIYICPLPV
jgi:hypothetical protein